MTRIAHMIGLAAFLALSFGAPVGRADLQTSYKLLLKRLD